MTSRGEEDRVHYRREDWCLGWVVAGTESSRNPVVVPVEA